MFPSSPSKTSNIQAHFERKSHSYSTQYTFAATSLLCLVWPVAYCGHRAIVESFSWLFSSFANAALCFHMSQAEISVVISGFAIQVNRPHLTSFFCCFLLVVKGSKATGNLVTTRAVAEASVQKKLNSLKSCWFFIQLRWQILLQTLHQHVAVYLMASSTVAVLVVVSNCRLWTESGCTSKHPCLCERHKPQI